MLIVILSSLISCEEDINPGFLLDNELILQLNAKATDTLTISSGTYVLDAYLWRDFMPVSPLDGRPMTSINWLINLDSVKIPDGINLIRQYVIYEDSIWISDYTNESGSQQPEYKIQKVSREGPKWGPEICVDVISQIRDAHANKDYYIRRKNVFVSRTD